MKFKSHLPYTSTLIDLTPLVDVIFLLLIFFLITSDISPLRSLNVEVPHVNRESAPLTTQFVVAMDAQHVIYVGDQRAIVDFSELKEYLEKEISILTHYYPDREPAVVLSVDRRAEYGPFLKLFSLVKEVSSTVRLVYQAKERMEEQQALVLPEEEQ